MPVVADAPPALGAPAVLGGADDRSGPAAAVGGPRALGASLESGALRLPCGDGIEVVRPAAWLRDAGDGRDAVDVVLRPCGRAVTVTWRDGRRIRFTVAALRAGGDHTS